VTAEEKLAELKTLLQIAIETSGLLRDDCPICRQSAKSEPPHLQVCSWPKLVEWADSEEQLGHQEKPSQPPR
jgi:hypothetical protein